MTQAQRATEFAVFCIENTADRLGRSGKEIFLELMRTNGISAFLYPSYPALHTQSKEYIVDEVVEYLHRHNPQFVNKEGGER